MAADALEFMTGDALVDRTQEQVLGVGAVGAVDRGIERADVRAQRRSRSPNIRPAVRCTAFFGTNGFSGSSTKVSSRVSLGSWRPFFIAARTAGQILGHRRRVHHHGGQRDRALPRVSPSVRSLIATSRLTVPSGR